MRKKMEGKKMAFPVAPTWPPSIGLIVINAGGNIDKIVYNEDFIKKAGFKVLNDNPFIFKLISPSFIIMINTSLGIFINNTESGQFQIMCTGEDFKNVKKAFKLGDIHAAIAIIAAVAEKEML